jgi:hypothetical protein
VPAYGDATGDGQFTLADLCQMVDWRVGRNLQQNPAPLPGTDRFKACDVNGDGKVDLIDPCLMVDKRVGRIKKFPIEP